MSEDSYDDIKESVLGHIQSLFHELEEDMAMSHQEKYTLLEDVFENASDAEELRVAFEQWYVDHSDDLNLEYTVSELWDQALGGEIDYDNYSSDDEGLSNFDEENEEEQDDEDKKKDINY
jgi:hypothetical protein